MLRMIVEGVGFDHLRQTVVVLKDWEGRKMLPIWIGPAEAKAIAWELENIPAPRPGSHDLLLTSIRLAQGRIARVVINDLQEATFYATIDIDTPGGLRHIDARPSDAIALAVRAKCPVFVDGGVLDALIELGDARIMRSGDADEPEEDSTHDPVSAGPVSWNSDDARGGSAEEIERFRRLIGDLSED